MYATPQKPVRRLLYLLPLLLLSPAIYGSSLLFTKNYSFSILNFSHHSGAKKDIHYYPVIIDTTRADTVIDKDGKVVIMQPLITDTVHEVFHPVEND